MPITQEDCDRVLARPVGFTEGDETDRGLKSHNKVYGDPQNEKQIQRNRNAVLAAEAIEEWRNTRPSVGGMFGFRMTVSEQGRALVAANARYGACGEMTAVTSYFCLEDPVMASKLVEMWKVTTARNDRGLHSLLAVSDRPGQFSNLRSLTIEALATTDKKDGVWFIDRWLRIACRASEFKDKMMKKLREYDDPTVKNKGTLKVLATGNGIAVEDVNGVPRPVAKDGKELPSAQDWGRVIAATPLSLSVLIPLPQRRLTAEGQSVREDRPGLQHAGRSQTDNTIGRGIGHSRGR
jgi:hypothetical protein